VFILIRGNNGRIHFRPFQKLLVIGRVKIGVDILGALLG